MMTTQLTLYPQAVPLPITEQARTMAQQFASAQPTAIKSEQVQLNTLAVFAIHGYCQMMGIVSDLEQSDSWNPVTQMMTDVADLTLPGLGRLECRPIQTGANICEVPPEVWDLRIGYVVVWIDENLKMAHLLGFTPTVGETALTISDLQPPETLLQRIHELMPSNEVATSSDMDQSQLAATAVKLGQWLNQSFEAGWLAVETLLSPEQVSLAFSFRHVDETDTDTPLDAVSDGPFADSLLDVKRAKLIDVGVHLGDVQVVMLVEIQSESSGAINIGLQVHPQGQPYLPPDLELAVLETSDTVFMDARARQADNYIQLQFSSRPGERFRVRLQLDGVQYLEEFVM
ncbi:DUF1822 family protein [Adonisia turfae]|uniref:DUF1822 family protein n=1 Tax=Adonisia turfae CCMR0081 TaxID=2292702 RepID=A0A6M0RPA5_9CYAN|nr:DUF1822 family protein [Adonisia turfae]NEZ57592.1 DUF1822 family protein [Adonisia turfae CCMR0081]